MNDVQLITAGLIASFSLLVLIGMLFVFAKVTEIGKNERVTKP